MVQSILYIKKNYTSEQSGKYTRYKIIYFTTLDTGKEFCSFWKTLEPASETNSNVAFF